MALSGVAEDFQITPNIGGETVTAGQSGGFGLSIQAAGGLTQSIALTCSGAPSESTCTVAPTSVTPSGSAASVVQVTLSTTSPSMLTPRPRSSPPMTGGPNPYLTPPLVLVLMMLASFLWVARWRAQPIAIRWYLRAAMSSALLLLALTVPGCGGGGAVAQHNPGTPAGTYSLTVTGTVTSDSATLTHSVTLKVTVQ